MNQIKHQQLLQKLLQQYVVPATGCTEPVSTALAAAHASRLLGKPVERIRVRVSANLMKNAMAVVIPGTERTGLAVAAALGAIAGDPDMELQVLDLQARGGDRTQQIQQAICLTDDGLVSVEITDVQSLLYSDVSVYGGNRSARVVIQDSHTQIVLKQRDDQVVYCKPSQRQPDQVTDASPTSLSQVYQYATTTPFAALRFILRAADLNGALSRSSLQVPVGLQVGLTIKKNIDKGLLSDDLLQQAVMMAAAASDARMGGIALPAMSNSGSGNQGIAATMPVVAVANFLGASQEQLTRALIISHLVAIHIKLHLDPLSAMCAAVTAGIGASCGITWLLGGELKQLEYAIFNMIADQTGVVCDGAKPGCAQKVASATSSAVRAALMAIQGNRVTCEQGIVEQDVEQAIDNLGRIGNRGMHQTDQEIMSIMMSPG